MLLMMVERNEPIEAIVFFDTGWEFPQMYEHIDRIERETGVKIWRLHPHEPFDYTMFHRPIRKMSEPNKGKIHRYGNGWPSHSRRWCTREKVNIIEKFSGHYDNPISVIGYAADEKKRIKDNSKYPKRYPLIEWGITEKDALQYCLDRGYDWGGLYGIFNRVSCYCCPLQRIGELKKLRQYFPDLWAKMLEMDAAMPEHNRGFMKYKTVHDMEKRFADEDRQGYLWN